MKCVAGATQIQFHGGGSINMVFSTHSYPSTSRFSWYLMEHGTLVSVGVEDGFKNIRD